MSSEKIAIPTNDKVNVEEHFGQCRQFAIYTIIDGEKNGVDFVSPPDHAPGVFPQFLQKQGADTIIAGGMGGRAIDLFKGRNITVILGASGNLEENLNTYLRGNLDSKGEPCAHHKHDGGCED